MIREVLIGAAAGAVGTLALNAVTYADMAIWGRPSSGVPAEVAGKLAGKAGLDLSGDDETTRNRKSGLGALSGYVVGLGVGAAYGAIHPHLAGASSAKAGVALGIAVMAGSDVPATVLGVTEPTKWPPSSWASDIVPHLAYGLATAAAYEVFTR